MPHITFYFGFQFTFQKNISLWREYVGGTQFNFTTVASKSHESIHHKELKMFTLLCIPCSGRAEHKSEIFGFRYLAAGGHFCAATCVIRIN